VWYVLWCWFLQTWRNVNNTVDVCVYWLNVFALNNLHIMHNIFNCWLCVFIVCPQILYDLLIAIDVTVMYEYDWSMLWWLFEFMQICCLSYLVDKNNGLVLLLKFVHCSAVILIDRFKLWRMLLSNCYWLYNLYCFLHTMLRIRPDVKEKNCIINISVFWWKKMYQFFSIIRIF
jgi:hypothetical protein